MPMQARKLFYDGVKKAIMSALVFVEVDGKRIEATDVRVERSGFGVQHLVVVAKTPAPVVAPAPAPEPAEPVESVETPRIDGDPAPLKRGPGRPRKDA